MDIYYHPEASELGQTISFGADESRHFTKVMRLREGDNLHITNGKGRLFGAVLLECKPFSCRVKNTVQMVDQKFNPSFCHLAVSPTKNPDRMEWLLEKAIEIGLNKITFIRTERCESRNLKADRLERIAIAAIKQSQQLWLPEIEFLDHFPKFLENCLEGARFIAHLENQDRQELMDLVMLNTNTCILIGPEGDFTPKEILLAKTAGFKPVSLGKNRLRTETAALYACFEVARNQTI